MGQSVPASNARNVVTSSSLTTFPDESGSAGSSVFFHPPVLEKSLQGQPTQVFIGQMPFLSINQEYQSTEGTWPNVGNYLAPTISRILPEQHQ